MDVLFGDKSSVTPQCLPTAPVTSMSKNDIDNLGTLGCGNMDPEKVQTLDAVDQIEPP